MKEVILDGWTIKDYKFNGVQRYAIEVINELDKIVKPNSGYKLLIRKKYRYLIDLKNIEIVELDVTTQRQWHIKAFWYLLKRNCVYVNFGNGIMLGRCSVIAIHDIYSFYNMINRSKTYYLKRMVSAYVNAIFARKIVTVSEYSKKTLLDKLPIRESKIEIIPNGWQHIIGIEEDHSVLSKNKLQSGSYYLFLGRLAKNKNIDWIYKVADNTANENAIFVIAGGLGSEQFDYYYGKNNNIVFTGFVSDSELRSLYKNCKAFILPSFMEGFGIPPMEALYCDVPIIISNTSSLPEIYGDAAHYIDPYRYDYDLDELLNQKVADRTTVLEKYSWEKSSLRWYKLLEEIR